MKGGTTVSRIGICAVAAALSLLFSLGMSMGTASSAAASSSQYIAVGAYQQTGTIPIDTTWKLAVDPLTNELFDSGYEVDAATGSVLTTALNAFTYSGTAVVDPNTGIAYESLPYPETIQAVNVATDQVQAVLVPAAEPGALAINSKTDTLYSTTTSPGCGISVWNLSGGADLPSAEIPLNSCSWTGPTGMAVNEQADLLYVLGNGDLLAISGSTNSIVASIPLPPGSTGGFVTYNPDTNEIYVGGAGGSPIIFDASTFQQIGTLGVQIGDNLVVDPSTDLMFSAVPLSSPSSFGLSVINGATNEVLQTIPVAPKSMAPSGYNYVAVNSETHAVYVSNNGNSVIDVFTPVRQAQNITLTSSMPSSVTVGSVDTLSGTGGQSGNPVTFSIDPSSTSGCGISGPTVTFNSPAGTCVIDANQAGDQLYMPAPQVQQSVAVTPEIASFSPTGATFGARIQAYGAGFTDATSVTVDGIPAQYTVASDTALSLVVPPGAMSGPITVTAGGETGSSVATVTVDPAVGAIEGLPGSPAPVGTTVEASVSLKAPTNTTSVATWNWGDGTTSSGVVSGSAGVGAVMGSHSYTAAGVYPVSVTVTDSDGGVGTSMYSSDIVVYNPSAGFVTGGGWIDSPAGALAPQPGATGKASFGFVAAYRAGATVPTGNTEFQVRSGEFDFRSSAYQWLVVNHHGTNAQLKGTGMVNGSGSYTFMIWAAQGSPDTFRIQIINRSTGVVVYDNGGDQQIKAGEIMIHS